jgi:hypothetical protein
MQQRLHKARDQDTDIRGLKKASDPFKKEMISCETEELTMPNSEKHQAIA